MNTDKDEQIFKKHLLDMAKAADQRGSLIFSDFLNLNEQDIFYRCKRDLPGIRYFATGGYPDGERKIICFCGNDSISGINEIDFPITCIKIVPKNQKFSDALNHRDFLGAILNLGIDRSKVGDILIDDNTGYVFCHETISYYITDQLTKIKHTHVNSSLIERNDFSYEPKYKEITGTVSSVRLDSILSVAFKGSRSSLSGLIEGGKVFVNSRVVLNNSYSLKEHDVVSVRGFGKFIFAGTGAQTKKGRYSIKILLYV